jgi:hypothetical protein
MAAAVFVGLEPQRVTVAEVGQQRDVEAVGADAETAEHAPGGAGADAGQQLAAVVGKGKIRGHGATLAAQSFYYS